MLQQPGLAQPGVGERLQGPEGLAGHDEERRLRVEAGELLCGVGRVDVADEAAGEPVLAVGLERLVGHHRTQVGAADADVDDRLDPPARHAGPLARPHALGEGVPPAQHLVHVGHDILAVHGQRRVGREAEGRVEHGPVLGDVDVLTGEHGVAAGRDPDLLGEAEQRGVDAIVEEVLGEVDEQVARPQGLVRNPGRVVGEVSPKVQVVAVSEAGQLGPGARGGGVDRTLTHARAASSDADRVFWRSSQATTNFSTPSWSRVLMTSS